MRRADRLFRLVQTLRGGRLWTARRLAEAMEVSERTVYRDMADLQASGVPIDGEAGVGYVMREGFDLPPLMFTHEEVAALALGARLVTAWGGVAQGGAARDALSKIDAAMGGRPTDAPLDRLYAPGRQMKEADRRAIDLVDAATRDQAVLRFAYSDESGRTSERSVRPLALWFWGTKWTLIAWCELRRDFRMFRIDRLSRIERAGRTFTHEPGRRLEDFTDAQAKEHGVAMPPDPLR